MPLFESYDRRIKQINEALAKYGIGSIEEAEQLCLSKGINHVEGTCYIISSRYGIDFAKLRLSADAACIIISLALTFAFGLTLKIREGTIAGMLVLGPLMGWCMKWEKKVLEHIDL